MVLCCTSVTSIKWAVSGSLDSFETMLVHGTTGPALSPLSSTVGLPFPAPAPDILHELLSARETNTLVSSSDAFVASEWWSLGRIQLQQQQNNGLQRLEITTV